MFCQTLLNLPSFETAEASAAEHADLFDTLQAHHCKLRPSFLITGLRQWQ